MIGEWVMRERYRVAHLVESVVAGDFVTHCGRRMADEPTRDGGGMDVAPPEARKCQSCVRASE